jgi:phage-related protein
MRDTFGFALYVAQVGQKHPQVKPLRGFGGAGVLQILEDFRGNTYRAVYTVKFKDVINVLHCFQKKSKKGAQTPAPEIDLIRQRFTLAQIHADQAEEINKGGNNEQH